MSIDPMKKAFGNVLSPDSAPAVKTPSRTKGETPLVFRRRIEHAERTGAKHLDLSCHYSWNDKFRLTEVPPEVFDLPQLETLNLRGNQLVDLPSEMKKLESLTSLNLCNNRFLNVPLVLRYLSHLQDLYIHSNKIRRFPDWFSNFQFLQTLTLGWDGFPKMPKILGKMPALITLFVWNSDAIQWPKKIILPKLEKLSFADLSGKIPPALTQHPRLNQLSMGSYGKTLRIPSFFSQLEGLEGFHTSGFLIESGLEHLSKLEKLNCLTLRSNKKQDIPEWIKERPSFKSLSLDEFKFTKWPSWLKHMDQLEELAVMEAALTSIPDWLSELSALKELNLANNNITEVPPEIEKLSHLEKLRLVGNQIQSLPIEFRRLQNLRELDFSDNQFREIPELIQDLPRLESIGFSYNNIQEIPKFLADMSTLESIDLSNGYSSEKEQKNNIQRIPQEILQLENLKNLNVEYNPVEFPPPEVVEDGWPAILQYLSQMQEQEQVRLYEAKMLIIGEGGAGKTTLAKKILNADYELDNKEDSTEGIEVLNWSFRTPQGQEFRANIWDFGGQEIYHATHQFFLTKRSFYALVADTRKEDTDFFYWLNVAELLSEQSPLIVVKNEKQDRHREINETELRARFKNLKETVAVNLADNRNLDQLLNEIKHHLCQLPHIGTALPKTWADVRRALEKNPCNTIRLDEYLELCQQHGFKSRADKLQLSGFLHDLGVCLHFQDDALLNKTVILKPQWGTDAVYRVLDNNQVIRKQGRFTQTDLQQIWSEEKYEDKHDELLQLMIKFKLCYRLPSRSDAYIAPQLLSENKPSYSWTNTETLQFRFKYDFMPKGMVRQLMVALHTWIENEDLVWKTGVVLNKDKTRAEVIENAHDRSIHIRVAGLHPRDLMTVVVHELEKINSAYPDLKVDQLFPCRCVECLDDAEPHFFLQKLVQRGLEREKTIQCQKSLEDVDPRALIENLQGSAEKRSIQREDRQVFISYSHKDQDWLKRFQKMLAPCVRKGGIALWADTDIRTGDRWFEAIQEALAKASVAVLLVSDDFLASDFIAEEELPPILKAAESEGLKIVWIPIKPCLYEQTAIGGYQAAHNPSKPLAGLSEHEQNEVLAKICREIV